MRDCPHNQFTPKNSKMVSNYLVHCDRPLAHLTHVTQSSQQAEEMVFLFLFFDIVRVVSLIFSHRQKSKLTEMQ